MDIKEVEGLTAQALSELAGAADGTALEGLRVKYLGRNGLLPALMQGLKDVPAADKPALGLALNRFKTDVTAAVKERKAALEAGTRPALEAGFDYSLPGRWPRQGRLHPITQLIDRTSAIFRRMGFVVADGPDIETEYYNFDALNTPPDHVSRDLGDTFYLPGGLLLRTQTSAVQARYMEQRQPPVRIVCPGRCYRRDTTDATHSANFHQIEGLYVDAKVSLADLKSDIDHFARELMGPAVKSRFRAHFFPFTEPSVEVDFSCHMCGGTGCRVCKQSGWIEIMGAGMVDPNVFQMAGYDPENVTGYAFGMGIERLAMILFGIDDIRRLYENDVRYLAQF
ncbi:MAG: phenylalanine--tRNA ligase subunit alpha [Kiritimatiellae bacterium]|nr:phenylalanine--tRNA ligase subunit alpha [Kiritimatiellia bacterium]NLD89655.1 phenylalanine--tRNA ligase subunit alpha [Lentisphaerota bacterium]HPC19181.1 phenylalanine--tRNA ligase subunit alpha [Kiritimatiellia bacterium]HQQ61442.1 phenylalanine--tRNA ligase subunit alpha [Kiritimatiellia bacterium]